MERSRPDQASGLWHPVSWLPRPVPEHLSLRLLLAVALARKLPLVLLLAVAVAVAVRLLVVESQGNLPSEDDGPYQSLDPE